MKIPFNKPYLIGKELVYAEDAVNYGKVSGNGIYTKKCHDFFEKKYHFNKCLLTTSCTDALEMSAILINLKSGDEVIIPSYTFVSTANAFVLRGAKIVFADSYFNHPNINAENISQLITPKTKAIVVVHYAGVSCDMEEISKLAKLHNLYLIEDCAQAIDSFYIDNEKKLIPLGSIGHLSTFSFHETKNIISGEGGMLVINDPNLTDRAEIIWEKGTNRAAFFRGQVDKYNWVDIGSSYLPSDIIAAFLFAQLEHIDQIQEQRKKIWQTYFTGLTSLADKKFFDLPEIPKYATNNAHMFYLVCRSLKERTELISFLQENDILSVFHYISLHKSPYYQSLNNSINELPNADNFTDKLLRLPMYYSLQNDEVMYIISKIKDFYGS